MSIVMDRLKASFYSLVHAATSRLAYAAPRIARVVSGATAADGSTTLDLVPDDPTFPPMAGVPLFHGLPAIKLTLKAGTRVVVEFSEADPARPFVRSWAGGEAISALSIAGGPPAAREGDSVQLTMTPADIAALAALLLTTGAFTPSGTPPSPPSKPQVFADGEITGGSSLISLG